MRSPLRSRSYLLLVAFVSGMSGCATPITIPEGTLQLREVVHILSREEMLTGNLRLTADNRRREPINWPDLYESLREYGMQDSDMTDGSVIAGRTQFYWNNVSSGIVRQWVRGSPVAKGLNVRVGNIVEVEQKGKFTTVVRVRYQTLAEGQCEYRSRDRNLGGQTVDAISLIAGSGPAGAASLYCPILEQEGWGPLPYIRGTEWFKPPLPKQ